MISLECEAITVFLNTASCVSNLQFLQININLTKVSDEVAQVNESAFKNDKSEENRKRN